MSLSLFAVADYRGAASEAHAAIALGPIADWATVFGYYGDRRDLVDLLLPPWKSILVKIRTRRRHASCGRITT